MAVVADEIVNHHDAHLVFVSMNPEQDDDLADQLRNLMKSKDRLTLVPGSTPPKTVLQAISCLDLLIGTRLPSLIFAARSNVPMIALAYDDKVSSFLKSIDLGQQSVGPKQWNPASLLELFESTLHRRDGIRDKIAASIPLLRERAEKSMLAIEQLEYPEHDQGQS